MPEYEANTTFPQAVQTLWDIDANRLTPEEDYKIDVQRSKHPCDKDDAADDPLFTYVNEDVFNRPTYAAFRKLLDNYSVEVGREEKVGQRELDEQRDFLDAVMETEPMKYLHKYCLAKNAHYNNREVTDSEADFKKILTNIWFDLYSRSRGSRGDSSGFEHVFAGEVKEGKVSGFHNWIMFWIEEKKGNIDYRGYIKPKSRDSSAETNDDDKILTLQFRFNGVEKFVGTSFIGVSPEFELALYTMAFMRTLHTGEEDNFVTLDVGGGESFDLNVKCHTYNGDQVGSCYVEATAHHD